MRRVQVAAVLVLAGLLGLIPLKAAAKSTAPPELSSIAYAVYDADYDFLNPGEKRLPAPFHRQHHQSDDSAPRGGAGGGGQDRPRG